MEKVKYYIFDNDLTHREYLINEKDQEKYIVVCVAKNENPYIVEWINHYLSLGFDKIMIGDNNDDDSLSELINDYINDGSVELFDCHGFKKFQYQFYSMFSTVGNYQWALYVDCDEFLEIPSYKDIKEYLRNKKDYDLICMNWMNFQDEGLNCHTEIPLKERNKYPQIPINQIANNGFVKSLVNGRYKCFFKSPHTPYDVTNIKCSYGGYCNGYYGQASYPLRYKEIYLKHYPLKSFEEFLNKRKRGWADCDLKAPFVEYFSGQSPVIEKFKHIEEMPRDDFYNQFDSYNVIMMNNKQNDLCFYKDALSILKTFHNKIIVMHYNDIDDSFYNNILEYSMWTDNKVVCIKDNSQIDTVMEKYTKDDKFYYIYTIS